MKKLILLLILASLVRVSNAQVATAANQVTGNNTLTTINSSIIDVYGQANSINLRLFSYKSQTQADLTQNISDTLAYIGKVLSGTTTTSLTNVTSTTSTSGTITAGSRMILLKASSDFVGTVDGVPFVGNEFLNITAPTNKTFPQMVYTISAGTLTRRVWN